MEDKKKISCGNILFCFYLIYILAIINIEWLNFIGKMAGMDLSFGIAEGITMILMLLILLLFRRSIQREILESSVCMFLGIGFVILYGCIMSVYPDTAWDTMNYHLIAQNPKFTNYFVEDFAYGNMQVWGFRLSDRLFYYFRYLLGYRYGTILNTLVLAVAYTQIYKLLGQGAYCISGNSHKWATRILGNKFFWSAAILLPLDAIYMFGCYYVDVLAIPIGLEVLRLLLQEKKSHCTMQTGYFALLCGIWIALKLTNVVYVVPCALIYLFLHIKSLRIRDWILIIFMGLYPFAVYLIFNGLCTGNPVFPYMNGIFHSPYYTDGNFKDMRWGGSTLIEKLLWIFYAAFRPTYRQSEMPDRLPGILVVAILGLFFVFVSVLLKKRKKEKLKISGKTCILIFITVISSILWAFTTGYSRYFIYGKVLWGFIAYGFVIWVTQYYKFGKVLYAVATALVSGCTLINIAISTIGHNWSLHSLRWDTFTSEIAAVLHDHDITTKHDLDVDLYVLTSHSTMGAAELTNQNVYALFLDYRPIISIDISKVLVEKMKQAEHPYDLHIRDWQDVEEYVQTANNNNLYIRDMSSVRLSIGNYEMISIELCNGRENTVWVSGNEQLLMDVSEISGDAIITFVGGRFYSNEESALQVIIYASDGKRKQELLSVDIDGIEPCRYELPISVRESDKELLIQAVYADGTVVSEDEDNKLFLINTTVSLEHEK